MNAEVTVSRVDVLRTRVTLAGLQGRQDRLRDGLTRSRLTSTADRLDWLMAQRTRDEVLAWNRRWNALGVECPEPTDGAFARPRSLSVPVRRKRRRKPLPPVVGLERQMEIMLAVIAKREAREGGMREAA